MNKGNNVLLIWPDMEKGFFDFDPAESIIGQNQMFFPLPLIYVAAALGKEWNYTLIDEGVEPLHDKLLQESDYYLISVNLAQRFTTDRIVQRLISYNKPIIIGGPLIKTLDHIFCHPHISKVYGEIEALEALHPEQGISVAESLSKDMKNGTLRKEYHAKGHADIKKNKPPRYDLVKKAKYFSLTMQTSRGCPYSCDFCQQVAFNGKHRRKSPEQVKAELDSLLKIGQNVTVVIIDDNLIGDMNIPEEKHDLFGLLNTFWEWQKKNNYPFDFVAHCSLEIAEHNDVVERMARVGINMIYIEIETVNDASLPNIHTKLTIEKEFLARIQTLQRYGMGIFAEIIIGFDHESEASIRRQIELIKKSCIPFVAPMLLVGLTGTPLHKRLTNDNRISSDPDAIAKPFRTNIIPLMQPQNFYDLYMHFFHEIYEPKEYFSRCINWIKSWNDSYVIPGKKGSLPSNVRLQRIFRSIIHQGILSKYRFEYVNYFLQSIIKFGRNYNKLSLAFYLGYIFQLVYNSTDSIDRFIRNIPQEIIDDWESRFPRNARN